ncbi:3-oxoacyl-ACP reductase FabG [Anaerobaca lacustris]|uniref:3-oxoacyl-ACP reductase FabG n=1 Tax=Anaerobaca lacustris TaxID=3044600 RepID=A0AAW6TTH6_9BACT|nr:3-oxoacyl-ACP reductase FabG [Sedimentisphaerales bacterium M17dextr]
MTRDVALITGASRGIGAAVAIRLAQDGYDIWLNYRSNHEAAQEVARQIADLQRRCVLLPFDVSDDAAAAEALGPLLKEQTPYILVNNAGINRDGLLFWMSRKDWKDVLDASLDGFYHVTSRVVGLMMQKKRGRIVNIVSTSGQTGMPGQVNYSAAKAGLIGATKALAKEVARSGVLVNAVSPGFIETDMTKDLPKADLLKMVPLRRFGTAAEVAGAVAFLCSDDAAYVTGHVLNVNGGIHV